MQESLVFGRWIDVNDESDVIDVNSTSGDVGGHHHEYLTGCEGFEILGADVLRQVAVQVDARDAVLRQLERDLLGGMLGTSEQQGAFTPDAIACTTAGLFSRSTQST